MSGLKVSMRGSLRHKLVGPALLLHAEEAEVLAAMDPEQVPFQLLHVGRFQGPAAHKTAQFCPFLTGTRLYTTKTHLLYLLNI